MVGSNGIDSLVPEQPPSQVSGENPSDLRKSVQSEVFPVEIAQLQGYSGCQIFLMRAGNNIFVRKVSKDIDYNERLQGQRDKLINLASLGIATPEVFGSGTEDGRFYFDMEYVRNTVLSRYIFGATYFNLETTITKVFDSLSILKANQDSYVDQSEFTKKISDLKTNKQIAESDYFSALLSELEIHDWSKIPVSPCHGDLTLENILVTDSGPIFIDTLDSFANSWLIDLAKLYQDPLIWWAYRDEEINRSMQARLVMVVEMLNERRLDLGLTQYECRTLRELIMLNTLRIVPYCTTTKHKNFLISSIKRFDVSAPF